MNHLAASIISLFIASSPAWSAPGQAPTEPTLDFSRSQRIESMTYVPYLDQDRGRVFYHDYREKVLPPLRFGQQLTRFTVILKPTLHVEDKFNSLVAAHDIRDVRENPSEAWKSCEASAALRRIVNEVGDFLPEKLQPKAAPAGYPSFCKVIFYAPNDRKQEVIQEIQSTKLVDLDFSVPACERNSPRVQNRVILAKLEKVAESMPALFDENFLEEDAQGIHGSLFDFGQAIHEAARLWPELYQGASESEFKRAFLRQLSLDEGGDGDALLSTSTAGSGFIVCVPEDLVIEH